MEFYVIRLKKNIPKKIKVYPSIQYHVFLVNMHYTPHWLSRQNQLFLKCQLLHLPTLQISFSRVIWKRKFLLSPSRSLQRKSYNCNTLLRKRDWITTRQNSLSHLFKPYQTWMKCHTSTHCGPIFQLVRVYLLFRLFSPVVIGYVTFHSFLFIFFIRCFYCLVYLLLPMVVF